MPFSVRNKKKRLEEKIQESSFDNFSFHSHTHTHTAHGILFFYYQFDAFWYCVREKFSKKKRRKSIEGSKSLSFNLRLFCRSTLFWICQGKYTNILCKWILNQPKCHREIIRTGFVLFFYINDMHTLSALFKFLYVINLEILQRKKRAKRNS